MIGLLLGCVAGIGLLIAASAFGVDERLATAWERSPSPWTELVDTQRRGPDLMLELVDAALARTGLDTAISSSGLAPALSIVGRDPASFVAETAAKALGGAAVITFGARASFGVTTPVTLLGVFGAAAALASAVETKTVMDRAKARRSEMLVALAGFMEVTRLAAQTRSVEGAMRVGIDAGVTWPFETLRRAVDQSDRLGDAPWVGVAALGRSFAMEDLVEVADVFAGASREGTRVNEMLRSRADVLRERVTNHEIAEAEARTEKLALPIAGIGFSLVTLLITGLLIPLTG
jgi:hypothetical protein